MLLNTHRKNAEKILKPSGIFVNNFIDPDSLQFNESMLICKNVRQYEVEVRVSMWYVCVVAAWCAGPAGQQIM